DAVEPAIAVPPDATWVTIAADGAVSGGVPGGAEPVQIGQLQIAAFVNPAGLEARGGNLFVETAASGVPTVGTPGRDGLGPLQQGMVEGSNVNVVEELVTMIATQRAYELNSKAIQTSDQMLQRLGQL
nr:flagellar hook-basal body complex protein [Rubrivivax sp.]